MIRKLVKIDEEKCDGCNLCIPSCPEGALQIVNGKAKLVSDKYCDGLGACLGECPQDAITIIETEAEDFDEEAVKERLAKKEPKQEVCDCPGSSPSSWVQENQIAEDASTVATKQKSELSQWPIQLTLVSPEADYFKGADLVIAADCVSFAYANFHDEFLKGKKLVIGCPKLDDVQYYLEKLTALFNAAQPKSILVLHMEVPCCYGLSGLVKQAIDASGKKIPFEAKVISIKGEQL